MDNLPNLRHTKLDRQAKIMLLNVAQYIKQLKLIEAASQGTDMNVNKSISVATTVSLSTVKKLVSQSRYVNDIEEIIKSPPKKRRRRPKIEINSFTEGIVRRKIHGYYANKLEVPTLKILTKELNDDGVLSCCREFVRQYLPKIGFERKRKLKSNQCLLMENMDVIQKRQIYLSTIKKRREDGRNIVYVDENYIDAANKISKCCQPEKYKKGEKQLIVVHAWANEGFINGTLLIFQNKTKAGHYFDDMNFENFKKWTKEKLVPNLPPNSTVVLNNASYNNVEIDKKPSSLALKQTMVDWLQRHNIDCSSDMYRSQLYELIQNTNVEKKLVIDEILKENGHDVLRLPPYHADLNPIELVWGPVKDQLGPLFHATIYSEMEEKLEQLFVACTQEHWANYLKHVLTIEDEYIQKDDIIDKNYDDMYQAHIVELSEDSPMKSSDEGSSSDEKDSDSD